VDWNGPIIKTIKGNVKWEIKTRNQAPVQNNAPQKRGIIFWFALSQDNVQAMQHPGNSTQECQDEIDPKIIINRAFFQVHSERGNKQT
jgi:hypothetical protein